MNQGEAIRVVAMLAAGFRQDVTDETAVLWARDLVPFDLTDALEAADIARQTSVFMPSAMEFVALVRDCRNVRVLEETKALPSVPIGCCDGQGFGHFYREHASEEMKGRVRKLLEAPKRRRDTTILEAFATVVKGTA